MLTRQRRGSAAFLGGTCAAFLSFSILLAGARAVPGQDGQSQRLLTVPQGTVLHASLRNSVGTNISVMGDRVEAMLLDPIVVADEIAFPGGTRLNGYVRDVTKPGRVKGNGKIGIVFTEAVLPNGVRTSINAGWEAEAPGAKKRDFWIIAGSAAGGALLGQVVGESGEKTKEGAVIGGAVGTGVVLLNKGRDIVLREGTILLTELKTPASVPAGS